MAVYKQFNTNEVVVSPFNANKRFRFENNQVTSSDVQIEYYQSQQGTYLSGSFDTGFNTILDGVNVFHSIKQLYYSNYLTSSYGDPMATMSFVPGPTDAQGNSLGQDAWNGNITGPRFENFLQSSLTQDRKFAQFSASAAPIMSAGTNTEISQSITVDWNFTFNGTNIAFAAGQPDLLSAGINETYVLSTATWDGALGDSPFLTTTDVLKVGGSTPVVNTNLIVTSGTTNGSITTPISSFTYNGNGIGGTITVSWTTFVAVITIATTGTSYKAGDTITMTAAQLNAIVSGTTFSGQTTFTLTATSFTTTQVQTINASQLVEERINPDVNGTLRGLTTKAISNIFQNATNTTAITLNYLQAPRGPSVISIPSMLYGEAIQPSSFQFEYTSSINFTRSIVDDDGQGNLIVTQSNSTGVPFFSGSVGQIFYSQGIAVITGPDSGSLREFAHNVGYKNNMNPNIMSSSLSYSSSITIDENQYKCTVTNNEFNYTTNPSALGTTGTLTATFNQLLKSFNAGDIDLTTTPNGTYIIEPLVLNGNTAATTYYIFDGNGANKNTIGQQYRIELLSAQGKSLEFVGWDGAETGTRNGLGQVQFNSTGSTVGIAQSFCDAINSVNGFNGEISASIETTTVSPSDPNNTVRLTQAQKGEIGNTPIKYANSFNLLLNQSVLPIPSRGQVSFGDTNQPATNPQPVSGDSLYVGTKGAILNVVVDTNKITNINVSSSTLSSTSNPTTIFSSGRNYSVGDALQINGSSFTNGTGVGFINLTSADVEKDKNTQIYHDFITGSEFSPYVTTIGLYNGSNELVCVGKLPRPLPISQQIDTTYMINFDTN